MTQNISQGERIHSIDIIRGIAVLGIFLVNWPVIAGIDSRDITGVYEGLDSYIRLFYDMFIQTKFYTIFSFLFGLGFYIFMTRAEAKTDRPKTLFVRRLLILLLFGFLHYVLFMGRRHFTYLCNYRVFLIFILQKKATYYFNMVNCTIKFHAIVHIIRFSCHVNRASRGVRPFHSNYAVRKLGLTNHRPILFFLL